jgi:hypothetical protein
MRSLTSVAREIGLTILIMLPPVAAYSAGPRKSYLWVEEIGLKRLG